MTDCGECGTTETQTTETQTAETQTTETQTTELKERGRPRTLPRMAAETTKDQRHSFLLN
jgi:hypothetical protein